MRGRMRTLFHSEVVSRAEYKTTTDHVYKELERLDRRIDESTNNSKDALREFKADLQESHRRALAIGGVVLVIVQIIIGIALHFI